MNIALLVLALAAPAAAADSGFGGDARLDKIAGAVSIVPEGSKTSYRARGGETILFGDSVRTAPGAVAQLVVGDSAAVLLHESTRMTLRGTPRRPVIDVARGEFLVGLKKRLKKGQRFKLRTPAAMVSVRGTLFWGKSDKDRNLTIAGFGHRVDVLALGKNVSVDAGMMTTVTYRKPPEQPRPHDIPEDYLQRFHVNGGLQGLEKLVALPPPAETTPR